MCVPGPPQETLDKQTHYAQTLSDKLWLMERQLEELQIDKDTRDKKSSELHSTVLRLEAEVHPMTQRHLGKELLLIAAGVSPVG